MKNKLCHYTNYCNFCKSKCKKQRLNNGLIFIIGICKNKKCNAYSERYLDVNTYCIDFKLKNYISISCYGCRNKNYFGHIIINYKPILIEETNNIYEALEIANKYIDNLESS